MTWDTALRDAEWGERFFHLTDPDGHELSFAWPMRYARSDGAPYTQIAEELYRDTGEGTIKIKEAGDVLVFDLPHKYIMGKEAARRCV